MKNKIIELETGENFYIIEELNYNNNKYVLGTKCDLKKDEIKEDELKLLKIEIKDDNLVLNDIKDENTINEITNRIMTKIQNS